MRFLSKLSNFRKNDSGAISIELALLASILLTLSIPVVDYGMASFHNVKLKNAVRSGLQYATVQKPNPEPDANGDFNVDASLLLIKDAVSATAPTSTQVAADGRILTAEMFCRCDEGVKVTCFQIDGTDAGCLDGEVARSYVRVKLEDTYQFYFPWAGMDETIILGTEQEVRLN